MSAMTGNPWKLAALGIAVVCDRPDHGDRRSEPTERQRARPVDNHDGAGRNNEGGPGVVLTCRGSRRPGARRCATSPGTSRGRDADPGGYRSPQSVREGADEGEDDRSAHGRACKRTSSLRGSLALPLL
jgi:hypothetical protein